MCSYDVIAVAYFNVHLSVLCQLFRGFISFRKMCPHAVMQIHNTFRLYHCLHLSEVFISETKIRSIRLSRKLDLRGRKDANDMIIKKYI